MKVLTSLILLSTISICLTIEPCPTNTEYMFINWINGIINSDAWPDWLPKFNCWVPDSMKKT
jgi:hypothetical protein